MLYAIILHHLFLLSINRDSKCIFGHGDGDPLVHLQVKKASFLDKPIVIRGYKCYSQMDYQLRYVIAHLIGNRI